MNDELRKLFNNFDNGRLTRRELMQALAMLAVIAPVRAAIGQGGGAPPTGRDTAGGGRRGRAIAPQDTIPAPPPFDATGWKTVWLDHLTYRTTDYKKAAAFYATLMGWKIRSDDGHQVVMDVADRVGSVIIKGDYQPPPRPVPTAPDSAAGRGRGGAPVNGIWDNF